MTDRSAAHDVLRDFTLTDDELQKAEELFPGLIRIVMVTRQKVRLLVEGEAWEFALDQTRADQATLQLAEQPYNDQNDLQEFAWSYVWHRAAEALLAVRQGHFEHRRILQERKRKKQRKAELRADH